MEHGEVVRMWDELGNKFVVFSREVLPLYLRQVFSDGREFGEVVRNFLALYCRAFFSGVHVDVTNVRKALTLSRRLEEVYGPAVNNTFMSFNDGNTFVVERVYPGYGKRAVFRDVLVVAVVTTLSRVVYDTDIKKQLRKVRRVLAMRGIEVDFEGGKVRSLPGEQLNLAVVVIVPHMTRYCRGWVDQLVNRFNRRCFRKRGARANALLIVKEVLPDARSRRITLPFSEFWSAFQGALEEVADWLRLRIQKLKQFIQSLKDAVMDRDRKEWLTRKSLQTLTTLVDILARIVRRVPEVKTRLDGLPEIVV